MEKHGRGRVHWVLAFAAMGFSLPAEAQIDEGKCEKYFGFDHAAGVRADYPALKIEDLRKLTLYSKLMIRGSQAVIADDKYCRRVEPHAQDKGLLLVTSDHFQFTVLKDGNLAAQGPAANRKELQ